MRKSEKESHPLIPWLRKCRRHLRYRMYLTGFLCTAIAAGLAYLAGSVYERLETGAARPPFTGSARVGAVLALLAAGTLLTVVVAELRLPDLRGVAGRVDQRLGLAELVSTGYEELALRGPEERRPVVVQALFETIEQRMAGWGVDRVVGIPLCSPFAGLLTVAVAILAVQVMPVRSNYGSAHGDLPLAAIAEVAADFDVGRLGEGVRRAAELVRREAEWRIDPYLNALASALERLSAALEAGQLSGEQSFRELNRLLGHLERAFGPPRSERSGGNQAGEGTADHGSGKSGDDRPGGSLGQDTPPYEQEEPIAGRRLTPDEVQRALQRLLSRLETATTERPEAAGAAPRAPERALSLPPEGPAHAETPRLANSESPQLRPGARALQAQVRSDLLIGAEPGGMGKGASERPGVGATEPDAGEARAAEDLSPSERVDVELPAVQAAGRRIRVDAPPEFSSEFQPARSGRGSTEAWRRRSEEPVPGEYLDRTKLDVVSTYFMRPGEPVD